MATESLIIRNLGPIQEVILEDIKPICIIIGQSGSGKSTIMKVLALFRWLYKMEMTREIVGLERKELDYDNYITSNRLDLLFRNDTEIIYRRDIEIAYRSNGLRYADLNPRPHALHLEKVCFISDNRIMLSLALAGQAMIQDFYFGQTKSDFEEALIKQSLYKFAYFGETQSLSIERKKIDKGDRYQVHSQDFEIDFGSASSGLQSSLPLATICSYYAQDFDIVKATNASILRYISETDRLSEMKPLSNVGDIPSRRISLHIEEPELSLSPEKQRSLINELIARCFSQRKSLKDYDMSLMMTTHSPYIINQLNLLVRAYDCGTYIEGANVNYKDLDVYLLSQTGLQSLKSLGKHYIDTMPLSEDINDIYNEYDKLGE